MMRKVLLTTAFLSLLPYAVVAQSLQESLAGAPDIPFAEWRDMTAGQTVVYEIDGNTYAYEAYRRGTNRIDIRLDSGGCVSGTWYMDEPAFCFDWEDGPLNCFRHKRLDGAIYVIGVENGEETVDIQKVSRIAPIPVQCGPALLSQFKPEALP